MTFRYDKYGPVTVPPVAVVATAVTVGGTLVAAADPTLIALLASFKDVLKDKLDTVWNKAASQSSDHVVEGTYAYEPMPQLARLAWHWPALFLYRQSERLFNRTQVYRCAESTGKLVYVMPPMPYAAAVRLDPIRVAVRTVLDSFIAQHGDPTTASGASPINANSLESFEFTEAKYGYLEGAELAQSHPMLEMTFSMRERMSFVDANYSALRWIVSTFAISTDAVCTAVTGVCTTLSTVNFNATASTVTTAGSP